MAGDGGLLEREPERSAFDALVAAARAGNGRLLVVAGPAGIGKTALLLDAAERSRAAGLRVLRARCTRIERDLGHGVVRQLFEPVFGEQARERLLAGVAAQAAPAFGAIGTVESEPAVRHGLVWLAANVGDDGPVMLVIDDAQWCDPPSWQFVRLLAQRLEELPVSVAVGWREGDPDERPEWLRELLEESAGELVVPMPLSAAATGTLTARRLGAEPSPSFAAALHRVTGGNPFYLSQMLQTLAADGAVPSAQAAGALAEQSPESVARSVLARLDRIGPEGLGLARALAVLEQDAELGVIAALAGLEPDAANTVADRLAAAAILERGRPLRFLHPIIATAVERELPAGLRASLHRAAAELLYREGRVERAAAHLLSVEPAGDPWVAGALEQAAGLAATHGAYESAEAVLERALAERPSDEVRARLLTALILVKSMGLRPGVEAVIEEALAVAARSPLRAEIVRICALALAAPVGVPHFDEACALLEDTIADERLTPQQRLALEAELASIVVVLRTKARPILDRLAERIDEKLPDSEDARTLSTAVALDRVLMMAGTAEEAIDLVGPTMAHYESDFDVARVTWTAAWAPAVLVWSGDLDGAERAFTFALERIRPRGHPLYLNAVEMWMAFINLQRGRLDDAEAHLDASFAAASGGDGGDLVPYNLAWRVMMRMQLRLLRGDVAGSLDEYERHVPLPAHMDETTLTAWLGVARAQALLLAGRPDEARTLAREALDATADDGLAAVRSPAAIVLAATGDLEPARRAASTEREVAERFGAPRWIANADTALGLINGDLAQLERAAAVLERSPFRLDLAAALIEHGAALRRAGERRAAREPLRRALELAHHHGAWLLSERASQELAASGARPRRIDVSGRDALTPAELRTARLAADGHSNREIAQLLWISPKTVETHLGRIYMKLGIGSRRELAHALDARPVPV